MVIALDSNVVIDLMRGLATVRENHFKALAAEAVFVLSALVSEELTFAVEQHPSADREKALLEVITKGMTVIPFERSDAEFSGRLRAGLETAGRRAPYADFLIGSHALVRGHALVTSNTRHFQHIAGLTLLDWRQPTSPDQDTNDA